MDEVKPKSINQLRKVVNETNGNGKFVLIPTKFKKFGDDIVRPTSADIKHINK